ncbi:MAG: hypothetical protein ACRC20_07210 [Segniliparus sp.]|uniref:hypothetical protein n=1 Tax=Segniliparus sp. TaxID=2804064 RepID=UPI003F2F131D
MHNRKPSLCGDEALTQYPLPFTRTCVAKADSDTVLVTAASIEPGAPSLHCSIKVNGHAVVERDNSLGASQTQCLYDLKQEWSPKQR